MPYYPQGGRSKSGNKYLDSYLNGIAPPNSFQQAFGGSGGSSGVDMESILAGVLGGANAGAASNNGMDINEFMNNTFDKVRGLAGKARSSLEDQLRAQLGQAQKQQEPVDSLDQFISELMGAVNQGQNGINFDYEQVLQDSNNDISSAFARDIQGVRQGIGRARNQANVGRREIQAMYEALSNNYSQGARQEVSQGERVAKAMQNVANQAQRQVTRSANQQLEEQAALAQGLGVEAALPEVAAAQRNNVQKVVEAIQGRGQRSANDTLTYSGTQQRYLDRGGKNALLEGTNRSADLLTQLQDFIHEANRDIAGLQSDKERALAANRGSVLESLSTAQATNSENLFDQLMDIARLKFDVEDSRADNARQNAAPEEDSPFPDFMNDYSRLIGQTSNPEQIKAILDQVIQGQEFREGRFQSEYTDEMIGLTPMQAGQLAVQALVEAGVTNRQDLELARMAAMRAVEGSN